MIYTLPNDFLNNKNTIDLNDIVFVKYTSRTKNEKIEVRLTTHCMIILIDGTKVINFETIKKSIDSKNIIFLAQNNYFMSEFIPKDKDYNALLVYFNDKFIENFILKYKINLKQTKSKINVLSIDYNKNNTYALNIELLQNYININNEILLKLKLEEIFLNTLNNENFLSFLNATYNTSVNRMQFIIESNIDNIETIDDMCSLTKLTHTKLRSYFLKRYNKNPKKWLNEKRLEKAIVLLKTTDKSIGNISNECGYATVSWFIHCFKNKYNNTPKEIRYKS